VFVNNFEKSSGMLKSIKSSWKKMIDGRSAKKVKSSIDEFSKRQEAGKRIMNKELPKKPGDK
jgi:hypothetical protein